MHISQQRHNLIVASNAVELITEAVMQVMGNDTSKEVGGVKQTRQIIADAVVARLASQVRMNQGA
jgi:hypothetical protein